MNKAFVVYLLMSLTGGALWLTAVSVADVEGWALGALIASEVLVLTSARPLERHFGKKKETEKEEA